MSTSNCYAITQRNRILALAAVPFLMSLAAGSPPATKSAGLISLALILAGGILSAELLGIVLIDWPRGRKRDYEIQYTPQKNTRKKQKPVFKPFNRKDDL